VNVEKFSDDLWIGVKDQSKLAIAGSPRNSFRASVICLVIGVELLKGLGDLQVYQTLSNSKYYNSKNGSQTTGDKLRGRKGNSPDRRLRPQSSR